MLTINDIPKEIIEGLKDPKIKTLRKQTVQKIFEQVKPGLLDDLQKQYNIPIIDIGRQIRHETNLYTPVCKICGKPTIRPKQWSVYPKYCSQECYHKDPEAKLKAKATMLEKYNVDNAMRNIVLKQKSREKWNNKTEEEKQAIQEKKRQTCLEKYGVECSLRNKEVKQKVIATNIQKYGNAVPMRSNIVKEKKAKTSLEKYGTTCSLHAPRIKRQRQLERYAFLLNKVRQNKDRVTPLFSFEEYALKGFGYDQIYTWRCNECGTEFNYYYCKANIPVCRKCHPCTISKGHQEVMDYIKEIRPDVDMLVNTREIIKPYELDIYLPEYNFAIEYNGEYWHLQKEYGYHQFKVELCKEYGVNLLYIWDRKWMHNETTKLIYKKLIKEKIFKL